MSKDPRVTSVLSDIRSLPFTDAAKKVLRSIVISGAAKAGLTSDDNVDRKKSQK